MTSRTFGHRRFRGSLRIGQWMMPVREKPPAVGLRKPLTVFHGQVDTVELAVEKSTPGRFGTRAVGKRRTKHSSQFFYNDGSFGKGASLQISVHILGFYVYMMILGEPRFPVVEAVRRQWSAHKYPPAKTGWQLQFAIGVKHCRRPLSLSGNGFRTK